MATGFKGGHLGQWRICIIFVTKLGSGQRLNILNCWKPFSEGSYDYSYLCASAGGRGWWIRGPQIENDSSACRGTGGQFLFA